MQIVIDVKEGYATQFLSILQSLDSRFFNKVTLEESSDFMKDKQYLQEELADMQSGKATMLSLDEFETRLDNVLSEYDR